MSEFKAGDTVVLNSGSPEATVVHVNDSGSQVQVLFWSEKLQEFVDCVFNSNTIRKVNS